MSAGAALGLAARDLYAQSWRLVLVNGALGLVLVAVLLLAAANPLALVLVPLAGPLAAALVYYLVIVSILMLIQSRLERRFTWTSRRRRRVVAAPATDGTGVCLFGSLDFFAAMNGIYAKYFSQPFPARTTIADAALPPGACVETDLVVKA